MTLQCNKHVDGPSNSGSGLNMHLNGKNVIIVGQNFSCKFYWYQVSAKRGPDSRFVVEANTKSW